MKNRYHAIVGLFWLFCQGSQAANFTVDSTIDAVDANAGDGVCADSGGLCTLRAAIMETNALTGTDSITLPGGETYRLSIIGRNEDDGATGDLDIRDSVTLSSNTPSIIDADGIDRAIQIRGFTLSVVLDGLIIRNGAVFDNSGGGVSALTTVGNFSDLTLTDSIVENNIGGGILSVFVTTITDSIVRDNESTLNFNNTSSPPGINVSRRQLSIVRSAIYDNVVPAGALFDPAGVHISDGMLILRDTTVSGNSHRGLEIADSSASLNNATIVNNGGEGIRIFAQVDSSVSVRNSIIADNGGADCDYFEVAPATISTDLVGPNITSDNSCGLVGGAPNTDPLLGPLEDVGPLSPAHVPLSGSPAIDAGSNLALGSDPDACSSFDQRGFTHAVDGDFDGLGRCDIGAVEANAEIVFKNGFEN